MELLWLAPGSAVLDVACGTRADLPLLEDRIGETGRLVGVDLTPAICAGLAPGPTAAAGATSSSTG